MIVLVMSSGVQNNTLGFDTLGFDFNRVFESSLYSVLVGAWWDENHLEHPEHVEHSDDDIDSPVNPLEQTGVGET